MAETFLIADLHFGHSNIINFLRADGSKLRDFDTIEEHDEVLIHNWNSVVSNRDKVYVLGDVSMSRKHLGKVGWLNGDKVLYKGNHDTAKLSEYVNAGFRDVRAFGVMDNLVLSHIPIHPMEMGRFRGNVHGHLHDKVVMNGPTPDHRYRCVSAEQTNMTPISFDVVRHEMPEQGS